MEVVLDSAVSFIEKFQGWEDSVNDILISSPEERSGLRSIFWLFDSGMFISVLGVSVIGVSPLVLPTQVVGVTVVIADFIISDCVDQTLD